MLNRLRQNPLATALIVFTLYSISFFAPLLFTTPDPNQHGIVGIAGAIGQWKQQVFLVSFMIIVVSLLGWWKKIGFTPLNRGGLKYLLPPMAYASFLLFAAMYSTHHTSWLLGATDPVQMLLFILVVLAVGFNEETMFRGILFHGFSTRFSIFAAVILSSLVFGVLHYLNLIEGAPLGRTTHQVLHAAAAGFLYIALRLRVGSIWPVMLFHAFWDFTSFNMDSMRAGTETTTVAISPMVGLAFELLPATLYGAFVYWRWSVYRKKSEHNRPLQTVVETG